jgi:hypothetical protein
VALSRLVYSSQTNRLLCFQALNKGYATVCNPLQDQIWVQIGCNSGSQDIGQGRSFFQPAGAATLNYGVFLNTPHQFPDPGVYGISAGAPGQSPRAETRSGSRARNARLPPIA